MILLTIITFNLNAEDLRRIVQLNGTWKFSIGDDKEWASPGFDDSNWDLIAVPSKWENQGYNDYNGYAWYRKTFSMHDYTPSGQIYLRIGRIDDVDEVYLNGKLLGGCGSFPPEYVTAYNQNRKYIIPRNYLNIDGENVLAVKVYDAYLEGGIVGGSVGIYIDEDYNFLDLAFAGPWKFHLGDNKQWRDPEYDDKDWADVEVPQEWENEGYKNYDGYAWYRRRFKVPQGFGVNDLYLSLGKIDDYDYVYVNGELIGSVFDLEKDGDYRRRGLEYRAQRLYRIPDGLLNENEINVIAVRVYDEVWRGGIYEGPIGIMREDHYKKFKRKNYSNQPFWDYIVDEFIND